MRRLSLYFSFLLAALVVTPNANAQGGLNLNQTYRDVIQLDFPAGQTQIPLPEGEWELLGLQEGQSSQVTRIWRVYLARVENNTLLGQIYIRINHDLAFGSGWVSSDFCERDNIYYIEVKSNRDGDVDCWAASRVRIKPKRWKGGRKQMLDSLLAKNVTIPQKMMRAVFIRKTEDNTLRLSYYFKVSPGVLATNEDIKTWAQDWKPKVDAGFLGELEVMKTKETFAPPEQPPKTVTSDEKKGDIEERLTRLKKLHDEGLITDSEYAGKRQEILKGL